MPLQLTNTITKRKEPFKPIRSNKVNIYCCGVTVYDLCHLGHARSYIVWDVLRRYLIWIGYKVNFVQNFTDIDDKILDRAAKEDCSMNEISERNIKEFDQDMNSLGILRPDSMPRATKCMDEIRLMIKKLEQKGAAYTSEGDVYFSVSKHSCYGELSGRDISKQQMNADGRLIEAQEYRKKNSLDFALWKSAKEGEPFFDSPWGKGRPGWHIECSAMIAKELGETIDIHLGGADLIFPHHENEIAQSETATGKKLANYWLHNGMVNVKGQKMSKSLGNFTTIRAILDKGISPMTLRYFVLQAHYRKPLDFTDAALQAASKGWGKLNNALCFGLKHSKRFNWPSAKKTNKDECDEQMNKERQSFISYMNDDINTSGALATLFDLARPLSSFSNKLERENNLQINKAESNKLFSKWTTLQELAAVLGLKAELTILEKSTKKNISLDNKIIEAIEERKAAKLAKNFQKADKIREELKSLGIELIDKPGGSTEWRKT